MNMALPLNIVLPLNGFPDRWALGKRPANDESYLHRAGLVLDLGRRKEHMTDGERPFHPPTLCLCSMHCAGVGCGKWGLYLYVVAL
jgi:hypothetical protein